MSETPPNRPASGLAEAGSKRQFVRNSGFSFVQQVVAISLAVLLVPFLLWRLGTEQYGLWLTLQIFGIFGLLSLAELGFQGAIVRYLVRFHAEGDQRAFRQLLATGFVLFTLIGIVSAVGLIVFAQTAFLDIFEISTPHRDEMRLALTVYSFSLLVGFPAMVLKAFFSAMQDIATLKIWETLDRIIFALLVFGVLLLTDRVIALVLVEQGTMLALFVAFALLARRRRPWFSLDPRLASTRSLRGVTGLSGMVLVTNASSLIYIKAPEALIGANLGPVTLAYYQIATRIPRVLKTLQGSLNAAVLPYVAGLDSDDPGSREGKRRFALLGLRVNYLMFVPVAVFVIVFAPDILRLWVGEQFAFLGTFLATYAVWQLSSVIIGFGTATLTRTAHYRRLVWQGPIINALFVAALVLFLDRFGLIAAFVALLLSGFVSAAIVLEACRGATGFTYGEFGRQVLLGPVAGSALAGGLVFAGAKAVLVAAGPIAGVAAIAVAGSLYVSVIYFGILDKSERARLAGALAKLRRGN